MASWDGQTNPRTGRPFQSQAEYDDYLGWYSGQQSASKASAEASDKSSRNAGPGYSWGNTQSSWVDPSSGYVYFGDYSGYMKDSNGNGDIVLPSDYAKQLYDQGQKGSGYIDPHTGQYYYNTTGSRDDPTKPGYEAVWDPAGDHKYNVAAEQNSRTYDYQADYGLGPGSEGIIPITHDASGTPTSFYAGTRGGGGQIFTSFADAKTARDSYAAWYPSQHPDQNPQAPTQTPTQTQQPTGELLNPGAGENYFDSTKDFYTKPSEASQYWGQTKNQPTNAQQQWNAYSGIFGNPEALDDVYQRGLKQAQVTLDRKSASAGWGDSGAAARATGNLGVAFTDAATKARENWALTGGQLASAADTANNQKFGQALNVDQGDLARMTAGQSAANSAENLQQNRLTGGLNSALQLGQLESGLIYSGLTSAQQQDLQLQLAGLQLKQQQGQLSAEQAYAEAQNYLQALGVAGNAAVNYYVTQKLGKKAA
jgi:hypothetical protein